MSLDEMAPGPAYISGTTTKTIPARRSSVVFDDLVFNRDGRFTLRAGFPMPFDFSGGVSDRFFVYYRAPEIEVDQSSVSVDGGCVTFAYTVRQPDGAPVDVSVDFYATVGQDSYGGHARQGASGADVSGHYQLSTTPDGATHHYLWNASHDLGSAASDAYVYVYARAGSRFIDNPRGLGGIFVGDVPGGVRCQPDVTAMLAAPELIGEDAPVDILDTMGLGPKSLAAADLNGDGKLDLVRGHVNLSGVSIALGRGDGGFEPELLIHESTVLSGDRFSVRAGDFNGDGATDLAVSGDEGIAIWLREGNTWDEAGFFPSVALLQRFAVGDVDGNGADDMIYAEDDGNITIAYAGDGSFETVTTQRTSAIALLDIEVMNADTYGGLDIVYRALVPFEGAAEGICVITTGLDRSFSEPACRVVNWAGYQPQVRDFQVDPNGLGNRLFYRRAFSSGFSDVWAAVYNPNWGFDESYLTDDACHQNSQPEGFTVGHFGPSWRFDGMTDLATSCEDWGWGSIGFFLASADDNETAVTYDVDFDDNATLIALDFTGDGIDDVATRRGVLRTTAPDDWPIVSVNSPIHEWSPSGADENATLAGDFDGDGVEQLVTLTTSSQFFPQETVSLSIDVVQYYSPNRRRSYNPVICTDQCRMPEHIILRAAQGDIDCDGVEDIVYATAVDNTLSVSVGAVSFANNEPTPIALPSPIDIFPLPFTLTVGRFLGGERDDIVIAGVNEQLQLVVVVLHWRDGEFLQFRDILDANPQAWLHKSFIANFDDGFPGNELVLIEHHPQPSNGPTRALVVRAGDCVDVQQPCTTLVRTLTLLEDEAPTLDGIASGDFDGDGLHELALQSRAWVDVDSVTRYDVSIVSVDTSNPTRLGGVTRDWPVAMCQGESSGYCAEPALGPLVGDVDHDGIDDLFIGWQRGRTWEVFGRDASRMFGVTVSERGDSALLADLDGDGLLDLVVLERGDSHVWLLGPGLPRIIPN